MALYREAFFNMRQPDGSFKEVTLSNFGYEVLEDFNKVDKDRNYWFTTIEQPANRPSTSAAWNFVGFILNYQNSRNDTRFTKVIAFELGSNSPNFFIRGAVDDTWGSWYTFKPSTLQNLAGEEIPFTENTPVTIPEL